MRTTRTGRFSSSVTALVVAVLSLAGTGPSPAQAQQLRPKLPDLSGIVTDPDWAIVLGKALFWDTSVGSDGIACASCHFHAGADARITNALSPGLLALPEPDLTFGATEARPPFAPFRTASGAPAGPNYTLVEDDFPFHQLADPGDRNSSLLVTTNDAVSSAGAFVGTFTGTNPVKHNDRCNNPSGEVFHAGGYPARQVEPRNTPSMINAIFNHRNFWDGRASNIFNGVGVFGQSEVENNPEARLIVRNGDRVELRSLVLPNASLASLAVGPPLNSLEMSCADRSFGDLGRKLLLPARRVLAQQAVHPQDSVFGTPGPFGDLRDRTGKGLARQHTYRQLIQRAFDPQYWNTPGQFAITADGQLRRGGPNSYAQIEHNFPLFFGLAVMLYGATLVSDNSPFDRGELSAAARRGQAVFEASSVGSPPGGGGCSGCHSGALFSQATAHTRQNFGDLVTRNNRPDGTGAITPALRDRGFFNIGVRPTAEDLGLGGTDPYGEPLSLARQFLLDNPDHEVQRTIVDGAFKVPSLRNVALTPPYFHNGGFANLHQVIEFYARGGNRRDAALSEPGASGDSTGTGLLGEGLISPPGPHKGSNAGDIPRPLNLSEEDIDDLIAFLKSLTDERVRCDRAPFDHPELPIPTGHKPTASKRGGKADDIWFVLPAVGADGYDPASGLCIPNAGDLFAPGMQARVGGPPAPPD